MFLIVSSALIAQNRVIELTGNLSYDSKISFEAANNEIHPVKVDLPGRKSPVLAGLLSVVLPGAGEYYSESYLKGAIFTAVEAAAIYVAVNYNNKGDGKTDEFERYANENWSVIRYADWLIAYEKADPNIIISRDPNIPDYQEVDWNLLNQFETGSHKLANYGEQQYYEMIGKYHQFSGGWNDFTSGANKWALSPNMLYYADMRGDANDFYNVASKAIIAIYLNHIISAVDAIITANKFNRNMEVSFDYKKVGLFYTAYNPSINLKFIF